MKKQNAIVLTHGKLDTVNAKTCHGLLRFTNRFSIKAVVDHSFEGRDAGEVMDGKPIGVAVYSSVAQYFEKNPSAEIETLVIGVATHGGLLPDAFVPEILAAIDHGCHVVNGLHDYLCDHPIIGPYAQKANRILTDIRKPKSMRELHFWHGEIYDIKAKVLAVLGVDCAIGKRTTCGMIYEMCNRKGIKTDMIYTGQTGWMQGYKHGFIFDSTLNDFISGEIERSIVECDREESPQVILLEGQSSLRNPSGPGGSEFLLSGNAKGVILQIAPDRKYFEGYERLNALLPTVEEEIELIHQYGSQVIGLTVYNQSLHTEKVKEIAHRYERLLGMPVVIPMTEGVDGLYKVISDYASA